jgi:esterase/lipase superfamily enzyme
MSDIIFENISLEEAENSENKPDAGNGEIQTRENLIVPVYYATDREPQYSDDCNAAYSGDRSKDGGIYLGMCSVSIPNIHRIGYLERPSWWKLWSRPKPQKHIVLLSTIQLEAIRFWSKLNGQIDASSHKDAFVFIHGYNVSFKTAALRTAQLATDLGFKGAPIMFSWPSKGNLWEYLSDEGAIQWSRPHLLQFLSHLCEKGNAQSLHIIAHSMGNRALLEVLQALNSPDISQGLLKQLILAAPDVDAGVFEQLAGFLTTKCERVTLYASSNDKALKASKAIHNYTRAGEAGSQLMILNGLDTVDASSVDTDFLGHGVFAEQRDLLQDMFYLLEHGLDPTRRFGLKQMQTEIGPFWSFSA